MIFLGNIKEYLQLETINNQNSKIINETIESSLTILWFESDHNELIIDGKKQAFSKNEIVFLTEFHKVEINNIDCIRFLRFNRPFYCILDHDTEVGCKGI